MICGSDLQPSLILFWGHWSFAGGQDLGTGFARGDCEKEWFSHRVPDLKSCALEPTLIGGLSGYALSPTPDLICELIPFQGSFSMLILILIEKSQMWDPDLIHFWSMKYEAGVPLSSILARSNEIWKPEILKVPMIFDLNDNLVCTSAKVKPRSEIFISWFWSCSLSLVRFLASGQCSLPESML